MHRLLVINPGSTSTKVAVYEDERPLFVESIRHSSDDLAAYPHILDQYGFRLEAILEPRPSDDACRRHPALRKHRIIPQTLCVKARRE